MPAPTAAPLPPALNPGPSFARVRVPTPAPLSQSRIGWTAVKGFLGRHPILCLALLSPGIPEYLSSSSALSTILVNPGWFFLQLLLNLGLYLPGVLLIREAMVRWKKGWGSVLLMGAAYGILEEGLALETLFYSRAGPVGGLGFYGHWMGVNWVWTAGILPVHMIFSISLPILLLGLALPQTRGKSLVGGRGLGLAFVTWAVDIPVLMVLIHFTYHYWMGWAVFFGSLLAIGLLVLAAYRAPASVLPTRSGLPRVTSLQAAFLGVAFFPPILLLESVLKYWGVAPTGTIVAIVAYELCLGLFILRTIGTVANERQLVAFAAGSIAVLAVIGFVAELPIPVTLVADLAAAWLLRHLWRKYPSALLSGVIPIPPGAFASV
jgi:hypothetical protein